MIFALKGFSVFLFAFWPILAITSIMALGGPGATNDKGNLRDIILILYYPVPIAIIYWLTGESLFGISGRSLFLSALVAVTLGVWGLGYFKLAFNVMRGINNDGYSVVDDKVYYDARLLPKADAKTLRPAEGDTFSWRVEYFLDKHHVYYRGRSIAGLDSSSFRRLDVETPFGGRSAYWGDDKHVVYNDTILEGAKPEDFEILHYSYAKSNGNVYHFDNKVENVDSTTFETIADFLAKDMNRIYYGHTAILPEADPVTFRIFDPTNTTSIAADKNNVYFIYTETHSRILEGVDKASLEVLEDGTYFKDANGVYHIQGYEVVREPLANPATFRTVRWSDETPYHATDGDHYWLNGSLIEPQN